MIFWAEFDLQIWKLGFLDTLLRMIDAGGWGCHTLFSSYNWFSSRVLLLEEVRGVRSLSWVAYSATTAVILSDRIGVVCRSYICFMRMLGLGNVWFWFTFIGG